MTTPTNGHMIAHASANGFAVAPFESRARTTTNVIDEFKAGLAERRKDRGNQAVNDALALLSAELDDRLQLIEITPDDDDLLAQIVDKDEVHEHGVDSVESLKKWRVGGPESNKRCFAIVDPHARVVYSAIYALQLVDEEPASVHTILHRPVTTLPSDAVVTGISCYSISTIQEENEHGQKEPLLPSAGQRLIEGMLSMYEGMNVPVEFVTGTFSPLRTLAKALGDLAKTLIKNPLALKRAALDHLRDKTNPVQKFHQGFGAVLDKIFVDANTPESKDGEDGLGVMVRYRYPLAPAERAKNIALFKQPDRNIAVSDALRAELEPQQSRWWSSRKLPWPLGGRTAGSTNAGNLKPV